MKLSGRDGARFIARPDDKIAATLLYGADAMRVALKRQALCAALVGEDDQAKLQLTRIDASELRKDGALLNDSLKSSGFFDEGAGIVLLEGAGDGLTDVIADALNAWTDGDKRLIVTAGILPARSKLRQLFETASTAVCVAIYDDPPGRDEIDAQLKKAGIGAVSPEAMRDVVSLATMLDPGDFAQTIEKIGIYKVGDDAPLSQEDVAVCAPATREAAVDDAIRAVADGQSKEVVPQLRRLEGQGIGPTTICIAATRHFRQIHAIAASDRGIESAVASLRPPVFGPRRDQLIRQARRWGVARCEAALELLNRTDLTLRSASDAPQAALVERAFIRLAMM